MRNDSPANNPSGIGGFVSRVGRHAEAPGVQSANSLLGGDVTVSSAGKYVSACRGLARAAYTTISDNLVAADPDAGHMARKRGRRGQHERLRAGELRWCAA